MKNKIKKIKLGEMFCGPGGIAKGAELANKKISKLFNVELTHAWAIDNDIDAIKTYINNIKGAKNNSVICTDVRALDLNQLKNISSINAFAFGFPCNDFSLVGEQKGFRGKFGPLYKYGKEILDIFEPEFFIAENVGGIRSSNNGDALKEIISELSRSGKKGYRITTHLYKFEEYGIPQSRHRVIIVGIKNELNLTFKPPKPTHKDSKDFVTCKSAITKPIISKSAANNELTKQHPRVIERLKHIKPGQNAWNADIPNSLKLNVKGAKISQIYKRLDPKKPAYTITGSGGGGTHVYHWSENRALTNREKARLQTFPDNFIFEGQKGAVKKQIGMAVPPEASRILFEAIIKTLQKDSYEFVEPNI